ncbi:MAG: hypothetical protein OHK0011_05420 [Turneriella sp.]
MRFHLLKLLLGFFSLNFAVAAIDYDFANTGEEGSTSEAPTVKESRQRASDNRRKDNLTTTDVFELFKGEQKVAIVSKKEERVQDAPATIYVVECGAGRNLPGFSRRG